MPSKNVTKLYVTNGYYHIYNRGVEKKQIFRDEQDYAVLLSYLKDYLSPKDSQLSQRLTDPNTPWKEKDKIIKKIRMNNFVDEITLMAYCLMPNHFHFLLKQQSQDAIDRFMNSFGTRYTLYFNKKYQRVGPLYQGTYKAVLVESDEQLVHLTRYIHRNPLKLSLPASQGDALQIQPSSYLDYIGKRKTAWLNPSEILSRFSEKNPRLSYYSFVHEQDEIASIQNLIIEED